MDHCTRAVLHSNMLDFRDRTVQTSTAGLALLILSSFFAPLDARSITFWRLALVWGVHCVLTDDPVDLDDVVDKAARIAAQEGYAKKGERVIITAGVPLGVAGATNMIRIAYVGGRPQGLKTTI